MLYGNAVAKRNTLKYRSIIRLLPQRFKRYGKRGGFRSKRIILDILFSLCAESFFGDGFVHTEVLGEILYKGLALNQRCIGYRQYLLGKGYHGFVAVHIAYDSVGEKVGINRGNIGVLFELGEVLAVFNNHTRCFATPLMVDDIVVVKLELTAPKAYKRAFRTTKHRAEAFWLVNGEGFCFRVIGSKGEAMGREGRIENVFNGKLWSNGSRSPRRGCDCCEVV